MRAAEVAVAEIHNKHESVLFSVFLRREFHEFRVRHAMIAMPHVLQECVKIRSVFYLCNILAGAHTTEQANAVVFIWQHTIEWLFMLDSHLP